MREPAEPVVMRDTAPQDRLLERPGTLKRHRRLLIGIAAAAAALGLLLAGLLHFRGTQASVDRSRLTIATVERGNFVRDIAADGQVVAAISPTLYAPAAGDVTLKANAGDAVAKGQILAIVDSPDLTAKLAQETASLQSMDIDWRRAKLQAARKLGHVRDAFEQAQVDQSTARRELDRSRKAYELGAYSELQVMRAQDAFEKAQFAFSEAKANYEAQPEQNRFDIDSTKALLDRQRFLVADLRRQVDALRIGSPVQGRVGQVQVTDRAYVAKDAPLLTVVDLSALVVQIKVPESLARNLAPGMSADLQGDGRHWRGSVSAVSPEVVNGEVVARVRFTDHRPRGLRQNQRLTVRIFIDRRANVLMVDRGTFLDQDGGRFAYVVHGNIAERRPIRVGVASVQKVEILGGLVPGDQIVISGTAAFNGAQRVILSD
ncbi:MAG TPA: efflux RND transporter periplasmic adaptor subunit [Steroidobacteraceae bacterium]|nr:efflux RND transporter periplasmic adaptor subunit [Steroidobacteraceae bacterium]